MGKPKTDQIDELKGKLALAEKYQSITLCLFQISSAVNHTRDLDELYESIHTALEQVVDCTNFFIAIYNEEDDSITFPYFRDTVDTCYPKVIGIKGTESQTAEVIQKGRPVFITKNEVLEKRNRTHKEVPSCTPAEIWLGVPLVNKKNTVGVMAVQSYTDPNLYSETDIEILVSVADQVALAIERKQMEEERELLIQQLQASLSEIKVLQGFIPICSNCKKIRDDDGYWQQVEEYIQDRTDSQFSHSICPDCIRKIYPDLNIDFNQS